MRYLLSILIIFSISASIASANPSLHDAFTPDGPLGDIRERAGYSGDESVNLESMIAEIIKISLSLLGVLFMVLLIYGGFLWMTDRGNSDQVEKAKKLITAAIIGLIIILLSYAISLFVFGRLSSGTLA